MELRQLKSELRSAADGAGVITKSQLLKYMGMSTHSKADRFLEGLEAVDGKYYFVNDVAKRIWSRVQ